MGKEVNLVEPQVDPNRIASVTITKQQLQKYLRQLHKESANSRNAKNAIVIEIILPRPMVPEETS